MADFKKRARKRERNSLQISEAEIIADAFGEARRSAESDGAALQKIIGLLDRAWEGNLKVRFLESLRTTSDRILTLLLPQLKTWETKYREETAETKAYGSGPD